MIDETLYHSFTRKRYFKSIIVIYLHSRTFHLMTKDVTKTKKVKEFITSSDYTDDHTKACNASNLELIIALQN